MKVPAEFPVIVKRGSSVVKIYRSATKGYPEFKVVHYDAARRRKISTFASYENARKAADRVVESLSSGNLKVLTLTNEDQLIYLRAQSALRSTQIPLDVAAAEFAKAKELLGSESLLEAVRIYLKGHRVLKAGTVAEIVKELIHEKENNPKRPASEDYLRDLRSRLGRFADAFHCDVRNVGAEEVKIFLDSLQVSGRTWSNYARVIRTFFRFAQARKYYPKDMDPFDGIELDFEDDGEIEIFTSNELVRLFEVARPEIVPFLALGAFAGLRHREIMRLDWQEILPSGYIEVKKAKSKVRSRRLVPIAGNLAKWLEPYQQPSGPVTRFANMSKQLLWLADSTKNPTDSPDEASPPFEVAWKHNALRHSFISYRLAFLGDENRVSMEAGNSPAMIYRNYRQLVTQEAAQQWFSIMPEKT